MREGAKMIRFNGYYSDKLLEKNDIRNMKTCMLFGVIAIVLAIVFAITGWKLKNETLFWWMCADLAAGVVLSIFCIIRLLYLIKRMPNPYIDLQIDDGMILFDDGAICKQMQISEVVKVKDLGYEYHICFSKNSDMKLCICQKDLLVEGNIADFENLFKDKLVRKK